MPRQVHVWTVGKDRHTLTNTVNPMRGKHHLKGLEHNAHYSAQGPADPHGSQCELLEMNGRTLASTAHATGEQVSFCMCLCVTHLASCIDSYIEF